MVESPGDTTLDHFAIMLEKYIYQIPTCIHWPINQPHHHEQWHPIDCGSNDLLAYAGDQDFDHPIHYQHPECKVPYDDFL